MQTWRRHDSLVEEIRLPCLHAAADQEMTTALHRPVDNADYEHGLDHVTAVASPRRRPRSAAVCLHQEQLISRSGLPPRVHRLTSRPWIVDKHSQPNSELAMGRQVHMPCALGVRSPPTGGGRGGTCERAAPAATARLAVCEALTDCGGFADCEIGGACLLVS